MEGRTAAGILNTCEMRGPLVERRAHLIEVGVFVVDAGHARGSMVEDALGDHIGYVELRKTRSAGTAQVVRREHSKPARDSSCVPLPA